MKFILSLLLCLTVAINISTSRPHLLSFSQSFQRSSLVVLPDPHSFDLVLFPGFYTNHAIDYSFFRILHHISTVSSPNSSILLGFSCEFDDYRFNLNSVELPNNQFTLSHLVTSLSDSSTDLILIAYDFLLNQTSLEHNELSLKIYSFLNYKSGKSFDNVVENELISIEIPSFSAENPNIPANISITHHSNSCNSSFPHLISFLSTVSLSFCISSTGFVQLDSITTTQASIPPLHSFNVFCFFQRHSITYTLTLTDSQLTIRDVLRRRTVTTEFSLFGIKSVTFLSSNDDISQFLCLACTLQSCAIRLLCVNFSNNELKWDVEAVSVDAGLHHSTVLFADGTLKTFGLNNNGRLGDGTLINRHLPVLSASNLHVVAVSCGTLHTLVIDVDGFVWGFGTGSHGQLGDSTSSTTSTPTQTKIVSNVVAVSSGLYHSLFLQGNGYLYASGSNAQGRLGLSGMPFTLTPVYIQGSYKAISAGNYHSLAIRSDGIAVAAGLGNGGRLGHGGIGDRSEMFPCLLITHGSMVKAADHSLVLTESGILWSFGPNSSGELGLGDSVLRETPEIVSTSLKFISISAGPSFSAGILDTGQLMMWGKNTNGLLLDGTSVKSQVPLMISPLSSVISVALGEEYVLALLSDNTVVSWGSNQYGKLGDGTVVDRNYPDVVQGLS
ncbi:hypothetical protein RCL1_006572 [Eukaryota sp. TZLM3-RCL]